MRGATGGLAQQLRLDRAARTAGEAFAFFDAEEPRPARSWNLPVSGIGAAFLALAALALYWGV